MSMDLGFPVEATFYQRKIYWDGKKRSYPQDALRSKENGLKENSMVKLSVLGKLEINTLVNGPKESAAAKGLVFGMPAIPTLEPGKTIGAMVMEC